MKYQYWLNNIETIGNVTIKELLAAFGSSEAVFHATEEQLRKCMFLKEEQIKVILDAKEKNNVESAISFLKNKEIHFTTSEQGNYPDALRELYDLPYGIYYKGMLPKKEEPLIAIVGARRCSAYGRAMAEELAYELAKAGYGIVSGMARGIDTAAHKGALAASGKTYAVLGCGVDICYPNENYLLYDEMIEHGGLISEYPPGTKPYGAQFPARNRLISGLVSKVIVVEAKEKSGSLITTDFALEQGRDIYAVPGRMTDPMSRGCNQLIAQGAGIICSISQFVTELEGGHFNDKNVLKEEKNEKIHLEKEETLVYSCFDFYPKSIQAVQEETQMDLFPLLATIMTLTEMGLIRECFKNQYIRLR